MARLEADEITNEGGAGRPTFNNGLYMPDEKALTAGARGGGCNSKHQFNVANGGSITLAMTGAGPATCGIICASSNRGFNGYRHDVYAYGGRGSSTPVQLFTKSESGGANFTIAHTASTIVMTNTSGATCDLSLIAFFGVGF